MPRVCLIESSVAGRWPRRPSGHQDWVSHQLMLAGSTRECQADRDTGPCQPNIVGAVHTTGDRNAYFTTTNGVALARAALETARERR